MRKSNIKERSNHGVITNAGNKQKLWKVARKKTLRSQKRTKISDAFYFNQFVEPAYSTDGEQNAQCQSERQCQKILKQMLQLIM